MTEVVAVAVVVAATDAAAAANDDNVVVDMGSLSMKFQEQLDQQRHPCTLESLQYWNGRFSIKAYNFGQ